MKCEFCNQQLKFSHKENGGEIGVYDCTNCPVLVSFHIRFAKPKIPETRVKTTFMLDRRGKTYLWINNYLKEESYILNLELFMSAVDNRGPLLTFPKIMNVTPTNVHEKFSFYMTFI